MDRLGVRRGDSEEVKSDFGRVGRLLTERPSGLDHQAKPQPTYKQKRALINPQQHDDMISLCILPSDPAKPEEGQAALILFGKDQNSSGILDVCR